MQKVLSFEKETDVAKTKNSQMEDLLEQLSQMSSMAKSMEEASGKGKAKGAAEDEGLPDLDDEDLKDDDIDADLDTGDVGDVGENEADSTSLGEQEEGSEEGSTE